jgi:ankyrin repeat protein/Flp pilus assembly protein TadD
MKASKTFRIFVSSTFSDLIDERSALQRSVFTRLRKYCNQRGARFQAIDLRWGVSEEALLDQQTMGICLQELRRCQEISPRPNFIVLLGDRYGWRPLPAQIEQQEFKALWARVPREQKRFLLRWYRKDKNAVPISYCLQPRCVDLGGDQTEQERQSARDAEALEWNQQIEPTLRRLLIHAAHEVFPDPADVRRQKYEDAATHQEIRQGALRAEDSRDHVFCYLREFDRLPGGGGSDAGLVDLRADGTLDQESRDRLQRLKDELESTFGIGHVHHYRAAGAVKWKRLKSLCRQVEQDLRTIIDGELATLQESSELESEIEGHERFMRQCVQSFVGRQNMLKRIKSYIGDSDARTLIIHGVSGSGKTALIAQAVEMTAKSRAPGAELTIVYRFIGSTPASSGVSSLLQSLSGQIATSYGDTRALPGEPRDVRQRFAELLRLASPTRPLVIFLDALDQLDAVKDERGPKAAEIRWPMSWLPAELPPNVKVIVSMLGSRKELIARDLVPQENLVQVRALAAKQAEHLLDLWLKQASRTLQPAQRNEVIKKFHKTGLPLYLKLAFERARHWKSHDEPPPLSPDVPGLLIQMLDDLEDERNHGRLLTSRALAYLALGRDGLTEDELFDLLSTDEEVLADFKRRSPRSPAVNRIPVVVWSRLRADLEPYLSERRANNAIVLSFRHREVSESVSPRYLNRNLEEALRRRLIEYFHSQPLSERKAYELPWQLNRTESWAELRDCITSADMLMMLDRTNRFDLYDYWERLGSWFDIVESHRNTLERNRAEPGYEQLVETVGRYIGFYASFVVNVRGEESSCRDLLQRAVEMCPNNAGVRYTYANFLFNFFRRRVGLQIIEHELAEVLRLDPDNKGARHTLRDLYREQARAHLDHNEWTDAIRDYDQLIELEPGYAGWYGNRAEARKESGDVAGALIDYDAALGINPEDAVLFSNRGVVRRMNGDDEGAEVDFNRSIELNPNDAVAYANLGLLLLCRGEWANARRNFEHCVTLSPQLRANLEVQIRRDLAERSSQGREVPPIAELLPRKSSTGRADIEALHSAAREGSAEAVLLLLESGVDVNAKDREGLSALHWAAKWNQAEIAAMLIAHGANVDAKDSIGGTALHSAAAVGALEVAELLTRNGATINAKDMVQATPLHDAASAGQSDVVRFLAANRADLAATDVNGFTPYDWALRKGHRLAVEILARANASTLGQNAISRTHDSDGSMRFEHRLASSPHLGADPERAYRLNLEYQQSLARWQALPWWRRLVIRKPERPAGI